MAERGRTPYRGRSLRRTMRDKEEFEPTMKHVASRAEPPAVIEEKMVEMHGQQVLVRVYESRSAVHPIQWWEHLGANKRRRSAP